MWPSFIKFWSKVFDLESGRRRDRRTYVKYGWMDRGNTYYHGGGIKPVKPVLSGHSKKDKTKILMTNGRLMKVESIAECSCWIMDNFYTWKVTYLHLWVCVWITSPSKRKARKPVFKVSNEVIYANQPVQLQILARKLEFHLQQI